MFYDDRSGGSMAERYPRRFGKYVLLKPLARGGMGEIYVAATGERGFQKFCVIKKVIAEKTDRGKANRFLDEAQVVLRLSHANLVPTFDAGEVDGEFYIAMELVEARTCVRSGTAACARGRASPWTWRCTSPARSRAPWPTCTATATSVSCTATSRRPTSCSASSAR